MTFLKNIVFSLCIVATFLFSATQPKVLSPEEAFKITAIKSGDVISIDVSLGENIYLYDDKLQLSITKPKEISIDADVKRPEAIDYEDFMIQKSSFKLLVPISVIKKYVNTNEFTLQLAFQGCSKNGICYQPMEKSFDFVLNVSNEKQNNQAQALSEEDSIANTLATSSLGIILLTFFGFGVLLSLTPCIFPMIPILSSIIVSQSDNMNTKRAFVLSLTYVLAMSVAYTFAGVMAGLFGANLQAALQNPWVISIFSMIFVLLAFSMFGFYNIQLPSFIQSALTKKSDQMQGHGVVGVAIMGFLSALIVGPCVAAPLAGALIYIGQSGDALLGGLALFMMSLGMGLPLILIGMSAGKFMPRPGEWMDNVKSIFGVVMLGVAIWMLSRIVSSEVTMALSTALVITSSVYMGALEQLEKSSSGWKKLVKSFAIILFIYGVFLFIGTLTKSSNILNPLENISTSKAVSVEKHESEFKRVKTLSELKSIINSSQKPVMLDFYADWCISCIELEKFTFSDAKVKSKLNDFLLLQVDVTKNSSDDKELLKEFGLFGPPAILFFKDGNEQKSKRIIGFKNADEFLFHLGSI